MGSKRVYPSNSALLLLVAMMLAGCVAAPPEQAEPDIPESDVQVEVRAAEAPSPSIDPVVLDLEPELVPEPEPHAEPENNDEPQVEPDPDPELPTIMFDPTTVSDEVKELALTDVKRLIQNLNTVIQTKNYDLWITNLTDDYLEYWSDPETLSRLSESPVLRRQNITLTTLRDYFVYVVYPSRQNDRVDDIEFIGETRIKAIIINSKGERLVLYNLEKIGDTWKIANWR